MHTSRNMEDVMEGLLKLMENCPKSQLDQWACKMGYAFFDIMKLGALIGKNKASDEDTSRQILQMVFTVSDVKYNNSWESATKNGYITRKLYEEELKKIKDDKHRNLCKEVFPLYTCYLHHKIGTSGIKVSTEPSEGILVYEASSYSVEAAREVMKKYLVQLVS